MEYAITPTRNDDYPQWYQQVIKAADLAETSSVRGCMVIKPWGYGVWERIRNELDKMIKDTGHENAYFPLFIPLSLLEKEAAHVAGFAKECAVVTHHRLEEKDGKLVPTGMLEEPLVVRPTSETIIGEAYSKWVKSYRDLPILINQWANVVRWEMRTRMFLRTSEFLWQEGHTAHATKLEAMEESIKMLHVYRELSEKILAMPVILGEKTEWERFPGAINTYCIEAMMQDRKALQAGTSHYMGQNFAKASNIKFLNQKGELDYAYTTSWGVSTRLIGGVIMCHSDDDGLRLPPRISPLQTVILPVLPKLETANSVLEFSNIVNNDLKNVEFFEQRIKSKIDTRDLRGGEKNWEWIKKGIPIRIEIGPREVGEKVVMLYRRDRKHKEGEKISLFDLKSRVGRILEEMQNNYFNEATKLRNSNITRDITNLEDFKAFFTPKNSDKPEIHGGFVIGKWCGDSENILENMKVTIRCIPLEQSGTSGKCVITGKDATVDALFAKSY